MKRRDLFDSFDEKLIDNGAAPLESIQRLLLDIFLDYLIGEEIPLNEDLK